MIAFIRSGEALKARLKKKEQQEKQPEKSPFIKPSAAPSPSPKPKPVVNLDDDIFADAGVYDAAAAMAKHAAEVEAAKARSAPVAVDADLMDVEMGPPRPPPTTTTRWFSNADYGETDGNEAAVMSAAMAGRFMMDGVVSIETGVAPAAASADDSDSEDEELSFKKPSVASSSAPAAPSTSCVKIKYIKTS